MTDLHWVCDLDVPRAEALAAPYAGARATSSLRDVLEDDAVAAVALATPAATHAELALACLRAGKHVLVEKPLAASTGEAEKMIAVAEEEHRVLMCDHTYCFTPAVQHIARLLGDGELGDLYFVDSVRINLGLVQTDVNVIWDLAPHDLSILEHILPPGQEVTSVAARGADPIGAGQACIGYLALELASGAIAHIHVNWLSPTKVRTMIIGGSRKTLVWDDLNPTQRISVYDRSVDLTTGDREVRHRSQVEYRIGDVVGPALRDGEALSGVITEFASAIHEEREPITGGQSGLRVLRILEAASASLRNGGVAVPVQISAGPR
jgi:predicted dehydrogenase